MDANGEIQGFEENSGGYGVEFVPKLLIFRAF